MSDTRSRLVLKRITEPGRKISLLTNTANPRIIASKGTQTRAACKVMSDSPGLVDFAIGLVNSVLNLPNGQVEIFFGELKLQKYCKTNVLNS